MLSGVVADDRVNVSRRRRDVYVLLSLPEGNTIVRLSRLDISNRSISRET